MPQNPRLGEQITRLARSLAAVKGWPMQSAMKYIANSTGYSVDTVFGWRQGRQCPSPEVVEKLAQIGKAEAKLDREWGKSLLQAARHPEAVAIVNKIWGPEKVSSNLPSPEHTDFIGRQAEIVRLLEYLSPNCGAHLISVDGIAGVGKSALVLEAACRCLRASTSEALDRGIPAFDAIIFVSAKQQYLTAEGILPRSGAQRTLSDIFHAVAQTLNRSEITHAAPEHQRSRVLEALSRQKTLLIIDNFETTEGKEDILSFLFGLPVTVKAVITTRERILFSPIRLEQLPEKEALDLIARHAQEKGKELNRQQALVLYQHIGGIPAALVYSIGQIASGYSLETVLDKVFDVSGDVVRFCFEASVQPLRGQSAHRLLLAIALFPMPPLRTALTYIAGLNLEPSIVEDGLAQLQRLSLISQQGERYRMLPLTHEYALAELAAHPDLEREARKRWIEWYLDFTREHGGNDWSGWQTKYDRVEEEWENLLAVFDWCAAHDQYNAIRAFWQEGRVLGVADIYGFWDDRLTWLTWLIQAAEGRGDWSAAVEAMGDIGFILTLMDQVGEADRLLSRAWDFHEHEDVATRVQIEVAQELSLLRIYQERYADAASLLNQSASLLNAAPLDEPERARRWILTQFYMGFLYYRQREYTTAKAYFSSMKEQAEAIGWQRATIYAENFLANIAIVEGRLDEAERWLQTGLIVSERNKDKRRTAHFQASLARFEKKRGNLEKARFWAQAALKGFKLLGMQREVKRMEEILQELQG